MTDASPAAGPETTTIAADNTAPGADGRADDGIAELGYEQARDELVRVVAELEQGAPTLEQSLALWERGERLAQRCEDWLIGARARLDAARSESAS